MKFTASVNKGIQELFPGYFALVMASGIISIAAQLLNYHIISQILFWLNNVAYGILLILLLLRLLAYFSRVASDLAAYGKGAGFFTVVAGTAIVGIQYAQLKQNYATATIFWYIALGTWLVLIYTYFVMITVKEKKPDLETGMNGVWLIMVVATQTIAILGTQLSAKLPFAQEKVLFFCLCCFLFGGLLYIILITLIFYRLTFFPTQPKELTSPFWINMGAVAITTLSGTTLVQHVSPPILDLLPFLKGLTLMAWATATWWIPVILLLEGWRHFIKKYPLTYNPKDWSMVFCLGTYTVSSIKLTKMLNIDFLAALPNVFVWIALIVWLVTFLSMGYTMIHTLRSKSSPEKVNT